MRRDTAPIRRLRSQASLVLAILSLVSGRQALADCAANPVHIQPPFGTTLPAGSVGKPYSTTISATGGTKPYTFVAPVPSALPPGVALNATSGAISGTPTKAGTYTFEIDVRDADGCEDSAIYQAEITNGGCDSTITLNPSGGKLPDGTVGQTYNEEIKASGGTEPYTYVISGGTPPPGGFGFDDDSLEGFPTTVGTYTFQVRVTDARGCTVTATYSITISQLAGCQILLAEDNDETALKGGKTGLVGGAVNAGTAGCTGTFEFDVSANTPNAAISGFEEPGSAFAVTCGAKGAGQKCTGTGTLAPGQSVGATIVVSANQDSIQAPWTVKWNDQEISGLAIIEVTTRGVVIRVPVNPPRKVQWGGK